MLDIKVKTKDFLRAIRIVENAITDDSKGGIYIETTEDNKLEFKAIGYNLFIKCYCDAFIINEGKILIKHKLIEEFLRKVKDEEVENAITDDSKGGIYIETTEDNKLEFKAIGYNLFIKCYCDAFIINEGKILIKHKLIEEFLRKVKDEEVEIKEENKKIKLITSDSVSNYSLIEYEQTQDIDIINGVEYTLDKKTLLENIENTQFAASSDIEKPKINCIKFDVEEKTLKLVATDSYRLMYREVEILENDTNENISVSIPLKITQALLKIFRETTLNKVIFRSEGTRVLFKLDDIEVITKVTELQFPDYVGILNNVKVDKKVKINKSDLHTALEKVQIFVRDKKEKKDVAEFLFTGDKLRISGFGEYGSTSSDVLIVKDCPDIKIYLNVKFIIEYLASVKNADILEINMSDEISAVLIKEDGNKNNNVYLTMPLKI